MSAYLEVAFNIPLPGTFTYRNLAASPAALGLRVAAPFGRRELVGWVVGESDSTDLPEAQIKEIRRRVDAEPLFGASTIGLARWMAGMYLAGVGECLAAMLPSGRREIGAPALASDDLPIVDHPLVLSEEQRSALDRITSAPSGTWYLSGLTGSGKTEVFLQAAEAGLAEGRGAIYLVPEIALTGQVVEAARLRFGERCAVLHSRLSPSNRLSEWRRILRGEADVVIGARSAVFAPIPKLGLIIIDEEHEGSYKASNAPRYHARQVAMKRAALEGARLVMGSATPSAEAWRLMAEGGVERLKLTRRLAGGALPKVEVVDLSGEGSPISGRLAAAVREAHRAGGQSILFLNRRGFSYFFRCKSCGAEIRCRHCSVALTFHKDRNALVCHWCGYRTSPPRACPECGSLDVGWSGFGTELVEEEATRLFPELRIGRLDADTTSKKGELEKVLSDFREGRLDLLLGTQMVAKGLNFPRVKTVGVVLADTSLNLPDFRAAERAFSLVVQVAGRAGRFSPDGLVVIQTLRPHSYVIRHAAALDVAGFYEEELAVRRELGFPPFARLIRLVFRAKDRDRAPSAAASFAEALAPSLPADAELLGPAECPIALVAGTARWQIILRAPELAGIHRALRDLLAVWDQPSGLRLEVDVDPVSLM
ncbi:MAG TPA: primosomal protein N' [Rectinemataceae bacterium]|nr:primosomal protein N' [Rectinemataceae bacterium]